MPRITVSVTTTEVRSYSGSIEVTDEQYAEWSDDLNDNYLNPNEVMEADLPYVLDDFQREWLIVSVACPRCGTEIKQAEAQLGVDCDICGYDTSQLWAEEDT